MPLVGYHKSSSLCGYGPQDEATTRAMQYDIHCPTNYNMLQCLPCSVNAGSTHFISANQARFAWANMTVFSSDQGSGQCQSSAQVGKREVWHQETNDGDWLVHGGRSNLPVGCQVILKSAFISWFSMPNCDSQTDCSPQLYTLWS